MPREMYVYMKYVKNLKNCETPNYKYLKELFLNILSLNGEKNDYIFSWVNKISNHTRLYSKNSKGRTNRMFFNLLLNASINLNKSDGSVNNHEVSNVGNKCDSIISNILKKNNNHSVGSNKIIIPYKKEKLNINSKKSNNNNENNEPNKNKNICHLYKTIGKSERKKEKEQINVYTIPDNLINNSYRKIYHQKTISYNIDSSLNISNIMNSKYKYKNKVIQNLISNNKIINNQKNPLFINKIKINTKSLNGNKVQKVANRKIVAGNSNV